MINKNNSSLKWIDTKIDQEINDFNKAIYSYLSFKSNSLELTETLINNNNSFQAPKILKIILILLSRDKNKIIIAKNIFKNIDISLVNDYFKDYLKVIDFWLKNNLEKVVNQLLEIIKKNPKDIFAIRLFHFNNIFIGMDETFLSNHENIIKEWNSSDEYYNLLLGMTSFANEENNNLDRAKLLATESLNLSKSDLWSWHALLHIHDNELITDVEKNKFFNDFNWSNYGPIKRHIWWHLALFYFYEGDYNESLSMYDNYVFNVETFYLDFCNASSYLLRLHYKGVNVRERMEKLLPIADYYKDQHILPFIDYHLIFYYQYMQNWDYLDKIEFILKNEYSKTTFYENIKDDLIPIIKNLNNDENINSININSNFKYLGGSFAQRELIYLGLIEKNNKIKTKLIENFHKIKKNSVNYV